MMLSGMVFNMVDLPPNESWLLCALLDHADHDGTRMFPSIAMLARKTRLSERYVQYGLRRLENRGLIEVVTRSSSNRPTEYRAVFLTSTGDARGAGRIPCGAHTNANLTSTGDAPGAPEKKKLRVKQENQKKDSMSGKPDNTLSQTQIVRDLIAYVNKVSGHHYEPVEANAKLIRARLAEGFSDWVLAAMVRWRYDTWKKEHPEMLEYFRPSTLFNATKCAAYVGAMPEELRQRAERKAQNPPA